MESHAKLKLICDKIGYEIHKDIFLCEYGYLNREYDCGVSEPIDVREIIFTQEFMDKFIDYRSNWNLKPTPCETLIGTFTKNLLGSIDRDGNLDNPVGYLAELLNIKE